MHKDFLQTKSGAHRRRWADPDPRSEERAGRVGHAEATRMEWDHRRLDEMEKRIQAERRWLDERKTTQEAIDTKVGTLREKHQAELARLDKERRRSTPMGDVARGVYARMQETRYEQALPKEPFWTRRKRTAFPERPLSCPILGREEKLEMEKGASCHSPRGIDPDDDADMATIGTAHARHATRLAPGQVRLVVVSPRRANVSAALANRPRPLPGDTVDAWRQNGQTRIARGDRDVVLTTTTPVYEACSAHAEACVPSQMELLAPTARNQGPIMAAGLTPPHLFPLRRYYLLLRWLHQWRV